VTLVDVAGGGEGGEGGLYGLGGLHSKPMLWKFSWPKSVSYPILFVSQKLTPQSGFSPLYEPPR